MFYSKSIKMEGAEPARPCLNLPLIYTQSNIAQTKFNKIYHTRKTNADMWRHQIPCKTLNTELQPHLFLASFPQFSNCYSVGKVYKVLRHLFA